MSAHQILPQERAEFKARIALNSGEPVLEVYYNVSMLATKGGFRAYLNNPHEGQRTDPKSRITINGQEVDDEAAENYLLNVIEPPNDTYEGEDLVRYKHEVFVSDVL